MKPASQLTKVPRRLSLGCAILLVLFVGFCGLMASVYMNLREVFYSVGVSGAEFEFSHLAHVAAETGIVFPSGTVGLEYHYQHGQDPYGFAKLLIPVEQREKFLARAGVKSGHYDVVPVMNGPGRSWWRPGALEQAQEIKGKPSRGAYVSCYLGDESGQWVVYVHWFYT